MSWLISYLWLCYNLFAFGASHPFQQSMFVLSHPLLYSVYAIIAGSDVTMGMPCSSESSLPEYAIITKISSAWFVFQENYGFDATMVGQGVKMVYVPFMPGHPKRLPLT